MAGQAAAAKSRSKAKAPPKAKPGAAKPSLLEWAAAAIGLAALLAVIGVLLVETLDGPDSAPDLNVRQTKVLAAASNYVVEVEVRNDGGSAAASVTVEGVLQSPGQAPERAEATLDYVPGGSTATGGLVFSRDPRLGRLTLKALGYADP